MAVQKDNNKSQLDKFKDAARELDCDDDEARFGATVKKVAKQKPELKGKTDG